MRICPIPSGRAAFGGPEVKASGHLLFREPLRIAISKFCVQQAQRDDVFILSN